ncbi:MAG: PH domain-containing protein [Bryobacteraceae bacterium]|jgi:hypothetical protein
MKQVSELVPPSGWAFTVTTTVLLAVMTGMAILFAWMAWSARQVRFEVSSEGLRIRSAFYGRSVPLQDLVVEQASIVDLRTDRQHQLSWRTNGIGLPGYSAGWFKTKSGDKALAFVTARDRVVSLPTRQGYSLLLTVAKPGEFLDALRSTAR